MTIECDDINYRDRVKALNPIAYYTFDADDLVGADTVSNRGSLPNTASLASGAAFTAGGYEGNGLSIADNSSQRLQVDGLKNVILTGFVPNAELPRYQAACDVLLMPYQRQVAASSGGDISRYLSPMSCLSTWRAADRSYPLISPCFEKSSMRTMPFYCRLGTWTPG